MQKRSSDLICPAAPVTAILIGEVMYLFSRSLFVCHPELSEGPRNTSRITQASFTHEAEFTVSNTRKHSCLCEIPRSPLGMTDQQRPVFSSNPRINRICPRTVRLELSCAIVRCPRRVQLKFAAVPGTLNRYFRRSRSVSMTTAIQESHAKSASMMAG